MSIILYSQFKLPSKLKLYRLKELSLDSDPGFISTESPMPWPLSECACENVITSDTIKDLKQCLCQPQQVTEAVEAKVDEMTGHLHYLETHTHRHCNHS